MLCPACARLDRTRRGEDPLLIAELRESFCLLHKHQPYQGWCSLFLKDHAEHLELMPRDRQERFWLDAMDAAGAIRGLLPRRLNYECLGNVVPHVHWHIIPRYESPDDPDPGSTIWTRPESELARPLDPAHARELISRLHHAGLRAPQ